MHWWIKNPLHSLDAPQHLHDNVLLQERFKLEEICQPPFNAKAEMAHLDSSSQVQSAEDGWTTSSVTIPVPCKVVLQEEATAHCYKITGC
jgi:hypothetical protein